MYLKKNLIWSIGIVAAVIVTIFFIVFAPTSTHQKISNDITHSSSETEQSGMLALKGTVLDAKTGQPIVGATVSDFQYGPKPYRSSITDEKGRYHYTTWPEKHFIIAKALGYEAQKLGLFVEDGKARKTLNFELQPNAHISEKVKETPEAKDDNKKNLTILDDNTERLFEELQEDIMEDIVGTRKVALVPKYLQDNNKYYPEEKAALLKTATKGYSMMGSENRRKAYDSLSEEEKKKISFKEFNEKKINEAFGHVYIGSRLMNMDPHTFRTSIKYLVDVKVHDVKIHSADMGRVKVEMIFKGPEEDAKPSSDTFWLRWTFHNNDWRWVIPGRKGHLTTEAEGRKSGRKSWYEDEEEK